jgi:hypothetical protein
MNFRPRRMPARPEFAAFRAAFYAARHNSVERARTLWHHPRFKGGPRASKKRNRGSNFFET